MTNIDTRPLCTALAYSTQMLVTVNEIQQYIQQRQEHARNKTGPLEPKVSSKSISVAYAKQDPEMMMKLPGFYW